jgi:hypothetical protein
VVTSNSHQAFKSFPTSSESASQRAPQNLLQRIKDLPLAVKIAGLVVGALLMLTVLSPLGFVVALLLFGVSFIGLIVRLGQGRSIKGWGIIAVVSLVFAFVFAGVSDALYGGVLSGSSNPGVGDAARTGETTSKGNAASKVDLKQATKEGSVEGTDIDPRLQEIVDDWRLLGTESPLLLPTYLPFPVAKVGPFSLGTQRYYWIWSKSGSQQPFAHQIRIGLIGPAPFPSSRYHEGTLKIDGRAYPYAEHLPGDIGPQQGAFGPEEGAYQVYLWMNSERGKEYMYRIEMYTMADPLLYEEFAKVVLSLKRMDPPERTSSAKKDTSPRKRSSL